MNWKEFFKVTKRKAIALCLLLLIFSILPTPHFFYSLFHISYSIDYSPIALLPILTVMGIIALIVGKLGFLSLILMLLCLVTILVINWTLSCLFIAILMRERTQNVIRESWKFLKPDLKKILFFILITIIVLSLIHFDFVDREVSVPLPLYNGLFGPCLFVPPPGMMVDCITDVILYQNLFLDLIIYYIFSCTVVWIYEKIKHKG